MATASNPFSPDFTSNDNATAISGGADTFDLLAPSATDNTGMAPQQSAAMSSFPPTLSQQPPSAFDTSMASPVASTLNTGDDDNDEGFGGPMGGTTGGLVMRGHGALDSMSTPMQSPPPLPNHNSPDPTAVTVGNGMNSLSMSQSKTGLQGPHTPPSLPNHTPSQYATTDSASVTSSSALTTKNTIPGEDSKENGEETEEDKMFKQAEHAALEAEKMIQKQAEEAKQKQEEGGLLGLGLIKAPQMPHLFGNNNNNDTSTNADGTPTKKAPWFQTATSTRDASTPPWHGAPANANAHAATSDFGIPPPATHDVTATTTGHNGNGTPGKGAAVMGATVVGGVAGLMMMGPLVGIAAAGGACYAAGTKEGPVGSLLRGTGSLAASAGGAAKRFDDKHHVVGKTVSGLATGVGWIVKTVNGATPD